MSNDEVGLRNGLYKGLCYEPLLDRVWTSSRLHSNHYWFIGQITTGLGTEPLLLWEQTTTALRTYHCNSVLIVEVHQIQSP